MIEAKSFENKDVAVLGLGRSGLAAARALMAGGARVLAWDDDRAARAHAEREQIPLVDLHVYDWAGRPALVLSPGIPLHHPIPHPVVARAMNAGSEVIGDIEILGRSREKASYVGITGTNGKSTTTALLGHVLNAAGKNIQVGGNLGTPALSLYPLDRDGTYVLEMSSYQLELMVSLVFDVAVLLNVSADHLDRHGGMDGYIKAKRLIFRGQGADQTAVIGVDDSHSRALFENLKSEGSCIVVPVSANGPVAGGVYVQDGILYDGTAPGENGSAVLVLDLRPITTLPGAHNWQNAAAAYAAARAVGVAPDGIAAGLKTYPGLAHRQEVISRIRDVTYINDSKATNADATARALACYDNIYWIAGGRAKEGGLSVLDPYLGRIGHAFLIGEAGDAFAAELEGRVPLDRSGTLETAVRAAHEMAHGQGTGTSVVLLSPAAASFDQFRNFEERGEAFRTLVRGLEGAS